MSFPRFNNLGLFAILCGLYPLLPAAGQTGIPLGVELSGVAAIPPNGIGTKICGRLWLDGTNLFYRFTRSPLDHLLTPIEVRGPASWETNGSLIFSLNPFDQPAPGYGLCDAAVSAPASPPPRPPFPFRLATGTVGITPTDVSELLSGRWYVNAVVRVGPNPHGVELPGFPVRGQILLLDSDGDGVPDYLDHCADTPPGSLINAQGCTIEQLCPCDGPWKNHGAYVHCLKKVLDDFVQEGLLDRKESHLLHKAGAQSDCGKRKVIIAPKR